MTAQEQLLLLRKRLEKLYFSHNHDLPFHGWHHITFVTTKAIEFGQEISADLFLVESASLVHDLNYIVKPNSNPSEGKTLRSQLLSEYNYSNDLIERIETIVIEAHIATRSRQISNEAKALSDADTLFKVLPITPIIFSNKYLLENNIDIAKLAKKIASEQNPLMEEKIYFYTSLANERYLEWGRINLSLWNNVNEALKDPDVQDLLNIAKQLGII